MIMRPARVTNKRSKLQEALLSSKKNRTTKLNAASFGMIRRTHITKLSGGYLFAGADSASAFPRRVNGTSIGTDRR